VSTCAQSLSILDTARQMRHASDRHIAGDARAADRSLDKVRSRAAEINRDLTLSEVIAWRDVVLSSQPQSLADAAAQIGILFDFVSSGLVASDPGGQPKSAELHAALEMVERLLAGLALAVSAAACVDLAEIGEKGLANRIAAYAPSTPAGLVRIEP
jgi:hypothetical protein